MDEDELLFEDEDVLEELLAEYGEDSEEYDPLIDRLDTFFDGDY